MTGRSARLLWSQEYFTMHPMVQTERERLKAEAKFDTNFSIIAPHIRPM